MGAPPRLLWDGLASFLHKPCQVGHISWAAGRRPGYPPAFLALCTHDLIPALQPPWGRSLCPTLQRRNCGLMEIAALSRWSSCKAPWWPKAPLG